MSSGGEFHLLSWGGLGDAILATPAFRAFKHQRPGVKLVVHCVKPGHYEIYCNNPYIDDLRPPSALNAARRFLMTRLNGAVLHEAGYGLLLPSLFYKCRAPHVIAEMLGLSLENDSLEVYLTRSEEERAKRLLEGIRVPVAIHITSSYSANQHWPFEYWMELVRRNPRYTFLQLGLPNERPVPGARDLRGAVPLRVAVAVLKHCASFVGVVSFFAHATNAVGTPGVVFYGPSSTAIWGHPNNLSLDLRVRCSPCVDILRSATCPYGAPCMSGISVTDVEHALEAQIASRAQRQQHQSSFEPQDQQRGVSELLAAQDDQDPRWTAHEEAAKKRS